MLFFYRNMKVILNILNIIFLIKYLIFTQKLKKKIMYRLKKL